jgi:sugar phosphate isomerase/epimerase
VPTDLVRDLAIQSYCFRAFKDNAKVIELVKQLGLNGIELCGIHANFDDESSFDRVIGQYQSAGIRIVSIGVEGLDGDEARCRRRFEFVRKAGASVMAVNFQPATFMATLPVIYKLADEYKIKLGIHNHGGYHWLGSAQILDWVFSITRCCLGLEMDTAWAIDAKQNPVEWATRYASRLYAVHLKDFVYDRSRMWKDVVVGTGNLDLPKLVATLKANNFAGPAILEYEGDPDNPVPALAQCVTDIRNAAK